MTDAQLAKAERLRDAAGLPHVRFLDGHIERLSMPDTAVDMVNSNGMINLSANKPAVFADSMTCNAGVRCDAGTAAASLRIGGKRR